MRPEASDFNKDMSKVPQAFHIIAKPHGPKCNLKCSYCFYLEKENLFPSNTDFRMPDEVLETFIKKKIEAHKIPQVSFAWQGGEPTLLGVEFFEKVVEFQQKYADGKQIDNGFQTNGVLLNDKWCEFLKENNFLVGLSIDGPEEIHNRYRLNQGGRGSFKMVMRGMDYLTKHKVEFNTLTVVQSDNSQVPLNVYNFLKEVGSGFLQFIPIVERISDDPTDEGLQLVSPNYYQSANLTEWSVKPEDFGDFLITLFDEWVQKDVAKYYVQLFDVALEAWTGMPASICVFNETCGTAMAIEHNGDIFSCDHYVYPENRLGNIMEEPIESIITKPLQIKFGQDKRDKLPEYCRKCEVRFICNGECPKHRFIKTPDGEEGLNYLCAGYRKFFNHINPYMQFMANELRYQRPPANVMTWAAEKDKGFPSFKLSPNDPCPCGSGKKLKKCCGRP